MSTAIWITRGRWPGEPGGPLDGLTFGIKDNIDLAGVPTTAACPAFSRVAESSARVVDLLLKAGATALGKTNLDQFATGLSGTRSPYGIPANAIHPPTIPGGSSSGSAVAVARGETDFALGTDTAGSGRVPAALNGIVGFKPTRGRWSTHGVVPACRSLDCVSVLTRTVAMAARVDRILAVADNDPFSRGRPSDYVLGPRFGPTVGILQPADREFFGNAEFAGLYDLAVRRARDLGWGITEVDFAPFLRVAEMLYSGPWVWERLAAAGVLLDERPDTLHPVIREILGRPPALNPLDVFVAQYRIAELASLCRPVWQAIDALLLPTTGTTYTVEQMCADPIRLNSNLGRYTNFMNLLDFSGLALPAGQTREGIPFGVTLAAPAWHDELLFALGAEFSGESLQPHAVGIRLAVVGAHLRGQPLNAQLTSRGARFVEQTKTAPIYRLHALAGTVPPKPGLERVPVGGSAIEVEVWELSPAAFGSFVTDVPPPLGIGTVVLDGGVAVKGFLCEPAALAHSVDITAFGGWRNYLSDLSTSRCG